MPTGTVKWFNEKKGYGFIHQDEGEDLFVHYSGIKMDGFRVLHEGERVTYQLGKGKKGPAAVDVAKLI